MQDLQRESVPSEVDALRAMAFAEEKRNRTWLWEYAHYLINCKRLGLDLADTKNAFPRQFQKRKRIVEDQVHEIERRAKVELAKQQDNQIAAVAKRFARLERTGKAYRVLLVRKTDDLIREGKRLRNCLGDGHYAAKMARGETVLAFVRRVASPGVAFVALEYSVDRKCVLQCYAAKNARPSAPVLQFVNRVFGKRKRVAA